MAERSKRCGRCGEFVPLSSLRLYVCVDSDALDVENDASDTALDSSEHPGLPSMLEPGSMLDSECLHPAIYGLAESPSVTHRIVSPDPVSATETPSIVSVLLSLADSDSPSHGRRPRRGALPLSKLNKSVFASLAAATEKWSEHHKTKTVTFRRGVLKISRSSAEHDSRFDTYVDNGPVARAFCALLRELLDHAEAARATGDAESLTTLALLHRHLTSLQHDACNQE